MTFLLRIKKSKGQKKVQMYKTDRVVQSFLFAEKVALSICITYTHSLSFFHFYFDQRKTAKPQRHTQKKQKKKKKERYRATVSARQRVS